MVNIRRRAVKGQAADNGVSVPWVTWRS